MPGGHSPFGTRAVGSGSLLPNPAQFPGMFLRLRSTSLTAAPLTAVSLWPDISGNGRDAGQAVGANQPKIGGNNAFNPKSPTGKNGVAFNFGDPDFMQGPLPGAAGGPGGIPSTTGQAYYLWFNESQFGGANQVAWNDQTGGRPQLIVEGAAQKPGWRDQTGVVAVGSALTSGFHSLVWTFAPPADGTGIGTVFQDGVKLGASTWNWNDGGTAASYILGANQVPGGAPFAGQMYELICYANFHTPAQVAQILRYGKAFWGF